MQPYPFKEIGFEDACDLTVKLIADSRSNIHLALSNGVSSEQVLRCFHRNGVKITPVIVIPEEQSAEFDPALELCDSLSIDPVVIRMTQGDVLLRYHRDIRSRLGGLLVDSAYTLIAADHIPEGSGVLVTGNHLLSARNNLAQYVGCSETQFYVEALRPGLSHCPFFFYAIESVYAMTREMDGNPNQDFLCRLFGIDFRDKFRYAYDKKYDVVFERMRQAGGIKPNLQREQTLGDRNQILNELKKWRIP